MSLTGQLNDLSLSELIEFFCNQRKTGRLKVDYALAPGVFFIKDGELVDAKVGGLNGAEAVWFALSLPSASFDFSAGMQSSRCTINEPWARVLLEGLRRMDEGILPETANAFVGDDQVDDITLTSASVVESDKGVQSPAATKAASADQPIASHPLPLSMTVEATGEVSSKRKVMMATVMVAILVVCAVAAIPISKRFTHGDATTTNEVTAPATASLPAPAPSPATTSDGVNPEAASSPAAAPDKAAAETAAAEEARREAREREARARARKLEGEAAAKTEAAPQPTAPPTTGAKSVKVLVTYDEAGRVTQASAAGVSPGAEAYSSTAIRVARGRHFPAGKAGSTVVTIPIN